MQPGFTIREYGARPHSGVHGEKNPTSRTSRVRFIDESVHNEHGAVEVHVKDGKALTPKGAALLAKAS